MKRISFKLKAFRRVGDSQLGEHQSVCVCVEGKKKVERVVRKIVFGVRS